MKGQQFDSWLEDEGEWTDGPHGHDLKYKVFRFGPDDHQSRALIVRYAPGCVIETHLHPTDYCSIVIEGSIEITRKVHEVGSIRVVKAGTAYGPLKAGPSGCTIVDIFSSGAAPDTPPITFVGAMASQGEH